MFDSVSRAPTCRAVVVAVGGLPCSQRGLMLAQGSRMGLRLHLKPGSCMLCTLRDGNPKIICPKQDSAAEQHCSCPDGGRAEHLVLP